MRVRKSFVWRGRRRDYARRGAHAAPHHAPSVRVSEDVHRRVMAHASLCGVPAGAVIEALLADVLGEHSA